MWLIPQLAIALRHATVCCDVTALTHSHDGTNIVLKRQNHDRKQYSRRSVGQRTVTRSAAHDYYVTYSHTSYCVGADSPYHWNRHDTAQVADLVTPFRLRPPHVAHTYPVTCHARLYHTSDTNIHDTWVTMGSRLTNTSGNRADTTHAMPTQHLTNNPPPVGLSRSRGSQ
jgi:hypothetical protein